MKNFLYLDNCEFIHALVLVFDHILYDALFFSYLGVFDLTP